VHCDLPVSREINHCFCQHERNSDISRNPHLTDSTIQWSYNEIRSHISRTIGVSPMAFTHAWRARAAQPIVNVNGIWQQESQIRRSLVNVLINPALSPPDSRQNTGDHSHLIKRTFAVFCYGTEFGSDLTSWWVSNPNSSFSVTWTDWSTKGLGRFWEEIRIQECRLIINNPW
jgi:hypothetical protein